MIDKLKEFYTGKWRETPALVFAIGIALGSVIWVLSPGHVKEGMTAALILGICVILFGISFGALSDRFIFHYARPHKYDSKSKYHWIAQWRRLAFISVVLLSLASAVG